MPCSSSSHPQWISRMLCNTRSPWAAYPPISFTIVCVGRGLGDLGVVYPQVSGPHIHLEPSARTPVSEFSSTTPVLNRRQLLTVAVFVRGIPDGRSRTVTQDPASHGGISLSQGCLREQRRGIILISDPNTIQVSFQQAPRQDSRFLNLSNRCLVLVLLVDRHRCRRA